MMLLLALASSILLIALSLKAYLMKTCGHYKIDRNLSDKVVMITGCTAGIGKEAALMFASAGAKIYMACRNVRKAREVAEEMMQQKHLKNDVTVLKCDLTDFQSIRECAAKFHETGDPLHILINNAGVVVINYNKISVVNGFEESMIANHLGHFLLTNLLLDKLKASAPSRIVVVSSRAHHHGNIDLANLNYEYGGYPGSYHAYATSKLANILFARELAKHLRDTGVVINSLHPGDVRTDLLRNVPAIFQPIVYIIYLFRKTAKEGAETLAYAAVAEELEHVSGHYFKDNRPATICMAAMNDKLARDLWIASKSICGL